jgi:hypothetical protein
MCSSILARSAWQQASPASHALVATVPHTRSLGPLEVVTVVTEEMEKE